VLQAELAGEFMEFFALRTISRHRERCFRILCLYDRECSKHARHVVVRLEIAIAEKSRCNRSSIPIAESRDLDEVEDRTRLYAVLPEYVNEIAAWSHDSIREPNQGHGAQPVCQVVIGLTAPVVEQRCLAEYSVNEQRRHRCEQEGPVAGRECVNDVCLPHGAEQ